MHSCIHSFIRRCVSQSVSAGGKARGKFEGRKKCIGRQSLRSALLPSRRPTKTLSPTRRLSWLSVEDMLLGCVWSGK